MLSLSSSEDGGGGTSPEPWFPCLPWCFPNLPLSIFSRIFTHFSEVSCLSLGHDLNSSLSTQKWAFSAVGLHLPAGFSLSSWFFISAKHLAAISSAAAFWCSTAVRWVLINSAMLPSFKLPLSSTYVAQYVQIFSLVLVFFRKSIL